MKSNLSQQETMTTQNIQFKSPLFRKKPWQNQKKVIKYYPLNLIYLIIYEHKNALKVHAFQQETMPTQNIQFKSPLFRNSDKIRKKEKKVLLIKLSCKFNLILILYKHKTELQYTITWNLCMFRYLLFFFFFYSI